MSTRLGGQGAADALVDAVSSLGLQARVEPQVEADRGHDVAVVLPAGEMIAIQVKSASLVTSDSAPGQRRRWSEHLAGGVVGVVIADRITAGGRDDLNRAGWGWLDLRGHLRLTGPGVFVDADVPALTSPGLDRPGLRGRVGIELAALLLLDPTERIGVRAAAATLSRAPSSISETFMAMEAAGLVDSDHRPVVPDLFWALADRWRPVGHDLVSIPGPGRGRDNDALRLGLDDVGSTIGWALTDTVAASVYGAPVSMRAGHPPDFYVPDQTTVRRALHLLGPALSASSRACRVRVAPVSLVCDRRVDATSWAREPWPLASPLFVALDLAQDPGRGREILEAWTPGSQWIRVW
ncbi:MAG: hypothetical protein ACRDRH_16690 [Pseudonocardia sp.]